MGHDGHDHDDHDHGHGHHGHGHRHGQHHHHGGHSKSADEHKAHAPVSVSGFVITCSDSRDEKADESGALIQRELESAGHSMVGRSVVKDEEDAIRLSNATQFGLAAYVWTRDIQRGHRVAHGIDTGMCWINSQNVR
ncbi:MAG: aldehyde dehydrogenase family protein, partial [Myxococcaceae bacterium]